MTYTLIRVVLFVVIGLMIWFGLRRIWRDWTGKFRELDQQDRQRDLSERRRPDVIDLKRDKDGKFRPDDRDEG